MSAVLLYDSRVVVLEGILEARITVYEVPKSKKFPHEIKLPHNKNHRVSLDVNNAEEAILLFLREARKLVQNEV